MFSKIIEGIKTEKYLLNNTENIIINKLKQQKIDENRKTLSLMKAYEYFRILLNGVKAMP